MVSSRLSKPARSTDMIEIDCRGVPRMRLILAQADQEGRKRAHLSRMGRRRRCALSGRVGQALIATSAINVFSKPPATALDALNGDLR